MGISYFTCDTCGLAMNDCFGGYIWWQCSGCDATYCDACVVGKWVTGGCSGFDFCEQCVAAGETCSWGTFGCPVCRGQQAAAHTRLSSPTGPCDQGCQASPAPR